MVGPSYFGRLMRRVRRSRFGPSVILGAAVFLLAGTTDFASSEPIQYAGCENVASGVVRLLTNTSLPAPWNQCLNQSNTSPLAAQLLQAQPNLLEVAVSWNQQGPVGPQGLSVQSNSLPTGDPNCPTGGSKFTVGTVTTYACNGKDGQNGLNGTNGKDGTSITSVAVATGDANCPSGGSAFISATGTSYACNGKDGANGTNGVNGTNGTNGKDGTSVTSLSLAAGDPTCPFGGSAFTSASGTTYACNGAPGAAGSAPTEYENTAAARQSVSLIPGGGLTTVASLSLPAGTYELFVDLLNSAPNGGRVSCLMDGDTFGVDIAMSAQTPLSWHKASIQGNAATVTVRCEATSSQINVVAWRFTAIVLGNVNLQ